MTMFATLFSALLGCIGEPDDPSDTETDDTATDTGTPPPPSPIGNGDGTTASVTWTRIIGADEGLEDPRDLGFDAAGNLWIANRVDDHTFIVYDPGTTTQTFDNREDGYAMHFMEETTAFSFDGNVQMGSCGESVNTYNDQVQGDRYMGPVLWSTDLNIFGVENPIGLGSHLDMSHESPYCVGIAWEDANVYWAFDGWDKALVRHDFVQDHGVGMDDHADGVVHQLTLPEMTRVEEAPGHLVIDHDSRILYAANTGDGTVLWVDIDSGSEGEEIRAHDIGVVRVEWDDATWGVLHEGLDEPGALAQLGQRLYVGEWGTGMIYEMDLSGKILNQLDTGFGPERLYGIEFGPDGKLWVIDNGSGVYRIDP